jgi:hypothetical protein
VKLIITDEGRDEGRVRIDRTRCARAPRGASAGLTAGASQVRTLGPISGGCEQFFKQEGSELDWDQLTRVIMQD